MIQNVKQISDSQFVFCPLFSAAIRENILFLHAQFKINRYEQEKFICRTEKLRNHHGLLVYNRFGMDGVPHSEQHVRRRRQWYRRSRLLGFRTLNWHHDFCLECNTYLVFTQGVRMEIRT